MATLLEQGEVVATLVQLAYNLARIAISGDLPHCDYPKSVGSVGVNYNTATGEAMNRSISIVSTPYLTLDLEDTFVRLSADVVFELDIEAHILKNMKIAAEGNLIGNIAATAKTAKTFASRHDKTVASYSLPAIWLMIGPVPVYLQFTVPLNVGYQVDVAASVSLRATANVSGRVAFGVQGSCTAKDVASCVFHQLGDYTFQHKASLQKPQIDFSASFQVYILPTVVLKVYKIAGPRLGLQMGLDTAIALSSSSSYCPRGDVPITANVNIDASIGARIDIGFVPGNGWTFQWSCIALLIL